VIKHSYASHAQIIIENQSNELSLVVIDDGNGFDSKTTLQKGGGNGLSGISERVKILKGILLFDDTVNKGTKIMIKIPLVP
jgi:signal transduction histidine kinase